MVCDFLQWLRPRRKIAFRLGPVSDRPLTNPIQGSAFMAKKLTAAVVSDFVLTDIQQASVALTETDAAGNPVGALPSGSTVTWSVSDNTVLTATPDPTGLTAIVASTGKLTVPGSPVQLNVAVTLPGATSPITGSLPIDVVASAAVSIGIVPGAPTPITPTP
jgi:hypothetical protein